MTSKIRACRFRSLAMIAILVILAAGVFVRAQEQSPAQNQTQTQDQSQTQGDHKHESIGGQLAKEEREATGEDQEENGNLKHSTLVKKFAQFVGVSPHAGYLIFLSINFAIIGFLVYWFGRKSVPALMANRSQSIQRALAEARAASEEANRRLAEIENRLRKLDVEIGQMQASAEKETAAEETRIKNAAEEDIRKVVESAEQEIAAAAKQARRELTQHTADLAVALAGKQIRVDAETDQHLISNFAGKLGSGKDGR